MRRLGAGAAAVALGGMVIACSFGAPATRTPEPHPTPSWRLPERTPFSPLRPTIAPSTPGTQIRLWPSPSTDSAFATDIPVPPPVEPIRFPADSLNIVLLGSDRRTSASFRTDTILVVSVQPSAGGVAIVSIPRDLYVYLPGLGMQRINTAVLYGDELNYPGGGTGLLRDTLLYNLGIPVQRFARVEMAGFVALVDALGGVDVPVACTYTDWQLKAPDLKTEKAASWELHTVNTGIVHTDGDEALWYARSRARSSDFDRARRQQEVLRALHQQALQIDLLLRLPEAYQELLGWVVTDVTLEDALGLAPMAARLQAVDIRSRFIGREQVDETRLPSSGAAVLLPRPAAIRQLLEQAFRLDSPDPGRPAPTLVLLRNGSGRQDWPTLAAGRLAYFGFEALDGPDVQERPETVLLEHGLARPAESSRLLSALGLPFRRLRSDPDLQALQPYEVLLGADFQPCFDPTRHQPPAN